MQHGGTCGFGRGLVEKWRVVWEGSVVRWYSVWLIPVLWSGSNSLCVFEGLCGVLVMGGEG